MLSEWKRHSERPPFRGAHKACIETIQLLHSSNGNRFNRYAELVVHFAEVAVQQRSEAGDGDLGTARLIVECWQEVLQGAKAAAAELDIEEDPDEAMDEDIVGSVLMWDPDWSDEHKAMASASWPRPLAQAASVQNNL